MVRRAEVAGKGKWKLSRSIPANRLIDFKGKRDPSIIWFNSCVTAHSGTPILSPITRACSRKASRPDGEFGEGRTKGLGKRFLLLAERF